MVYVTQLLALKWVFVEKQRSARSYFCISSFFPYYLLAFVEC
jgi:hypothetical protein